MDSMDFRIPDKILKYEQFINDSLKEDLKKIHYKLDRLNGEMSEYIQLKNIIESFQDADFIKDGLKTKVDVGSNFYMQAHVPNMSTIFVDVGCGHFVEFSMSEALKVIGKRLNLLERHKCVLKDQSANTKAHIKLVLHGIQELEKIK